MSRIVPQLTPDEEEDVRSLIVYGSAWRFPALVEEGLSIDITTPTPPTDAEIEAVKEYKRRGVDFYQHLSKFLKDVWTSIMRMSKEEYRNSDWSHPRERRLRRLFIAGAARSGFIDIPETVILRLTYYKICLTSNDRERARYEEEDDKRDMRSRWYNPYEGVREMFEGYEIRTPPIPHKRPRMENQDA